LQFLLKQLFFITQGVLQLISNFSKGQHGKIIIFFFFSFCGFLIKANNFSIILGEDEVMMEGTWQKGEGRVK
jgi:hypothetical protein